jgi:hypothetical protein
LFLPGTQSTRILHGVAAIQLFAAMAAAQTLNWVELSPPSSPSARCCMGMTYDSAAHSTVLFGGGNGTGVPYIAYGDTWTWTSNHGWSQLSPPASPPARQGPGMAYDAATGVVVLFGGVDTSGTNLNDTWTWDGVTWTQQFPPVSPPGRQFDTPGMTYDAATRTIVFFGGLLSNQDVLGDTWTWDGVTKAWTQQFPATSPSARRTGVTYDAANGTVILFGGDIRNGNRGAGIYLGDTWTWDGVTWTQLFPAVAPAARATTCLTYDANLGAVVLFGGSSDFDSGQAWNDTWTWNGKDWTKRLPATRPPARWVAGLDFDPLTRGLVLFSGENNSGFLDDTWLFTLVPSN